MKKLINKILCHFCKHFLLCPYCKRYEKGEPLSNSDEISTVLEGRMTNKEAIEILSKDLGKYILTGHDVAILTAIDALEERSQGMTGS